MRVFLCTLIAAAGACAQKPVPVSPAEYSFAIVHGGPLGVKANLRIQTAGKWSVKAEKADWVMAVPSEGAGPAVVVVSLNSGAMGLAVGAHEAQLTVLAADSAPAAIPVRLRVAARSADPLFSYIAGPNGCTRPPEFPPGDAAVCVVPDEKPPGLFRPPQPGGSYVDPNFGARVQILTQPPSLHGYSSPSALSATSRYILLSIEGIPSVMEVATRKIVARPQTPFEGAMWDPVDDETYYFLQESAVRKFHVRSKKISTVADYRKAPHRFTAIKTGSRGDTSKDGWISFFAPNEFAVCAVNLKSVETYCARYDQPVNGITLNANNGGALIAKGVDAGTSKRYVLLITLPTIAVYSVNAAAGRLDFEHLGPEIPDWNGNENGVCDPGESCLRGDHIDTFEDSAGRQWILTALETTRPCEYSMNALALAKGPRMALPIEVGGGRRRIMLLFRCGGPDAWTDWHSGCAKSGSYCVVSTTYGGFQGQRNAADRSPIRRTAHMSEIFVIREIGQEVRRLAQHRSVPLTGEEAQSYWTTPRACISPDGSYVVAGSNFGEPGAHRVMLIETGFGKTAAPAK